MNKERTERLVAMGQMAASMAHEIRNPLGGMELFCSLLAKELREKDEAKLQNLAEQILKGIRTVDRVIQNCLQFAREVNPQKIEVPDVREYLNEMVELVRARANDYQVTLEVTCDSGIQGFFDPFLLQQALVNLLSNGVDAVHERVRRHLKEGLGEPEKRVSLRGTVNEEGIILEVRDTGDGVSEELQSKIFDPFMTTKTTGTGLGLAITHSIVRAHEGDIQVENHDGAVFRILLPHQPRKEVTGEVRV